MSSIYILDNDVKVGHQEGRVVVTRAGEEVDSYPECDVEDITIMGKAQVTTQCLCWAMENAIPVVYMGRGAKIYGILKAPSGVNTERQRKQCALYDTEFALEFARSIISTKIHNELAVLRRFERSRGVSLLEINRAMTICRTKVLYAGTINEMIGYEGFAARKYFCGLGQLVDDSFYFASRSRRPAKDEFNALLNIGYTFLHNLLYNEIEKKGLNSYFGFIHRDNNTNQTLASDLMEIWRPVIIDSVIVSAVNGSEITVANFEKAEGKIILDKEGYGILLDKIYEKLSTVTSYVGVQCTYLQAISRQVSNLVKAINSEDVEEINNMRIR